MSITPSSSSNFFPSSDGVGYVLYPPVSPDFPELKRSIDVPGSGPMPPTTTPRWINLEAPGYSPTPEHPIDLPVSKEEEQKIAECVLRARPFPATHVKFDLTVVSLSKPMDIPKKPQESDSISISVEDQLPPKKLPSSSSPHAFSGYD